MLPRSKMYGQVAQAGSPEQSSLWLLKYLQFTGLYPLNLQATWTGSSVRPFLIWLAIVLCILLHGLSQVNNFILLCNSQVRRLEFFTILALIHHIFDILQPLCLFLIMLWHATVIPQFCINVSRSLNRFLNWKYWIVSFITVTVVMTLTIASVKSSLAFVVVVQRNMSFFEKLPWMGTTIPAGLSILAHLTNYPAFHAQITIPTFVNMLILGFACCFSAESSRIASIIVEKLQKKEVLQKLTETRKTCQNLGDLIVDCNRLFGGVTLVCCIYDLTFFITCIAYLVKDHDRISDESDLDYQKRVFVDNATAKALLMVMPMVLFDSLGRLYVCFYMHDKVRTSGAIGRIRIA